MVQISREGFADLVRRATAGTMRSRGPSPQLLKLSLNERAKVGEECIVRGKMRRARGGALRVLQGDEALYDGPAAAPKFHVRIKPRSADPIRLVLELEPLRPSMPPRRFMYEFTVDPLVVAPTLTVSAPRSVEVGDAIIFRWAAPAAGDVTLEIDHGEGRLERTLQPTGSIRFSAKHPGILLCRFTAHGPFASTGVAKTIRIKARTRTPRIVLEGPAVRTGVPGAKITFGWQITGAQKAYLVALSRLTERRRSIDLNGEVSLTIEVEGEEFEIHAVGYRGRTASKRLSIVPRLIGVLDRPEDGPSL